MAGDAWLDLTVELSEQDRSIDLDHPWLTEEDDPTSADWSVSEAPLASDPTPPAAHPGVPAIPVDAACPVFTKGDILDPPPCGGLTGSMRERASDYQHHSIHDPLDWWPDVVHAPSRALRRPSAMSSFRLLAHYARSADHAAGDDGTVRDKYLREQVLADGGGRPSPMQRWAETADFGAVGLLRLLYLFSDVVVPADPKHPPRNLVPCDAQQMAREQLLGFKYFGDEAARRPDPPNEAVYWSENHQLLYATAEYLAGQLLPGEDFQPTVHWEKEAGHWEVTTDPAWRMTGADRMARAYPRLVRWLDHRLMFGFSEWNSPVYYEYDIAGLLNLVDFCDDRAVRDKAAIALDVLLVDLAQYCSTGGGATSGRAKGSHKYAGWGSSLANTLQILFGTWRLDPNAEAVLEDWRKDTVEARRTEFGNGIREAAEDRGEEFPDQTVHEALEKYDAEGHLERDRATWPPVTTPWTVADSPGAHSLATTTRYCIPDLLTVLARDPEQPWFGRSRVSIGFEEGRKVYGIGFTEDRDVVAWWSRAGFGAPPLIASSRRLAAAWAVQEKAPFADIPGMFTKVPMPGPGVLLAPRTMSDAELEAGAALLSVESEGSCLTTANLALWREGSIALSSAQKFRFGQVGRQAHVWHASLDPYTAVFSTYPAARSTEGDDDDGPNWWVGNASQPRVVQHEDALICIHDSVLFGYVHDAYGYRSHAWFPVPMFEEAYEVRPNDDGDTDVGLVLDLHTLSVRRDHTLGINAERGGTWWFGRRGSAYVGLFSAKKGSRLMRTGRWAWREILCEDRVNVFVVQVGTAERFGTMEDFMRACCRARIHVGLGVYQPSNPFVDVQVSYDVPSKERLELHLDKRYPRYHGQAFSDEGFPRWQHPGTFVPFGARDYRLTSYGAGGRAVVLEHDCASGHRSGTGL